MFYDLLHLSWLPRARTLLIRFIRQWMKDMWLYITIISSCLLICINVLYKTIDIVGQNVLLIEEDFQLTASTEEKMIRNLNHFVNVLQANGVKEEDVKQISSLVEKFFDKGVMIGAQMHLSGQFNSAENVFKIKRIAINVSGLSFEITGNNGYELKVLKGDELVNLKVEKVDSFKKLMKRINVPVAIQEQCKNAYYKYPFNFNSKFSTVVLYQNPGKANRFYKLLLMGNGAKIDDFNGVIGVGKGFEILGQRVDYKIIKEVSREEVGADLSVPMRHPLPGAVITSGFGYRTKPRKGFHYGIDYRASIGTPIRCALGGRVVIAQRYGNYGNLIVVANGAVKTVYGHLDRIDVSVGQKVEAGQAIGTVGNTGRSTGPHLHFEVRLNNKPVNPLKYLGGTFKNVVNTRKEKLVHKESAAATSMKQKLLRGLL